MIKASELSKAAQAKLRKWHSEGWLNGKALWAKKKGRGYSLRAELDGFDFDNDGTWEPIQVNIALSESEDAA